MIVDKDNFYLQVHHFWSAIEEYLILLEGYVLLALVPYHNH